MSTSLHRSVLCAALATTAGCASFEGEVIPDVVRAELAVDRNAPDELAVVDVSLRLTALRRADHTIDLWEVWLMQPTRDVSTHRLKLALPAGTLDLDPNEQREVDLVNVGTTNADLIGLCHQAVDVLLNIRYVDDPANGFTDVEPLRVTVACTP